MDYFRTMSIQQSRLAKPGYLFAASEEDDWNSIEGQVERLWERDGKAVFGGSTDG
jgi:hypothetical protein